MTSSSPLVCLWCAFLRLLWLLRIEVCSCLCADGHATCHRAQAPPEAFLHCKVQNGSSCGTCVQFVTDDMISPCASWAPLVGGMCGSSRWLSPHRTTLTKTKCCSFFSHVVVVDFPRLVGIWPLFDLSQLHGPAALAAVGSGQVLHGSAISSPGRGPGSGRGYQERIRRRPWIHASSERLKQSMCLPRRSEWQTLSRSLSGCLYHCLLCSQFSLEERFKQF